MSALVHRLTAAAFCLMALGASNLATQGQAEEATMPVGIARLDITPSHPVRLVGYADRSEESQGVAGRLWAKALAIGSDQGDGPLVWIMVDNCGVPGTLTAELAQWLAKERGIKAERLAVSATHTHTAPWLVGFIPAHFIEPLPAAHQEHLERYTAFLLGALKRLASDALDARRPARLDWAVGRLGFAVNRRMIKDGRWAGFGVNQQGAVDHDMPLLRVSAPDGKILAVMAGYACHCTTLTGNHNEIHGDWAGCAQRIIEEQHPGTMAMITIGCGGDANPEPRGEMEHTEQNGRAVAEEVGRMLRQPMKPLRSPFTARSKTVQLPFDTPPSREELLLRTAKPGPAANHAKAWLSRLDRGESIPTAMPYTVVVWTFAHDAAMVFLPGEVVCDYSLRLKRELDKERLWVTAYTNDVPCYIASRRLLPEGGYEVDSSMLSYGQPGRLAAEAEDVIVGAVHDLVPSEFDGAR